MRTFEEIQADIRHAARTSDGAALRALALELQDLGTNTAEAQAQNAFGSADMVTGQYQSAQIHFQRALALFEEQQDQRGVAVVVGNMAHVESLRGNYSRALELAHRALTVHTHLGDRKNMATSMWAIGLSYFNMGDNPLAVKTYRQALDLFEAVEDPYGVANVIGSIGVVYNATGDYPSALEYLRRMLAMCQEQGNLAGVAHAVSNIGNVYSSVGDYALALEQKHKALILHQELTDRYGIAIDTGDIGQAHRCLGDLPQALAYLRQAHNMFVELGNTADAIRMTDTIVSTLFDAGEVQEAKELLQRQESALNRAQVTRSEHAINCARIAEHDQDFDAAYHRLQDALRICVEGGKRQHIAECHKLLRDLARQRNDFAAYIEHNNEYNRITEEIRGKEATQRLTMMEAERQMEAERRERDKERALLYGALPESVATRMLRGEDVSGDLYDNAAVLFLDIVGFTAISDKLPPAQVVQFLEQVFSSLDGIVKKYEMTKIKTIGDSYLAVSFPRYARNDSTHTINVSESIVIPNDVRDVVERAASAALEMLDAVSHIPSPASSPNGSPESSPLQVRIGLHVGPVTAGVLGKERLQYDVWGDTVNVASRMESTGEPGRIHISSSFALALKGEIAKQRKGETDVIPSDSEEQSASSQFPVPYSLQEHGALEIKGKGLMTTYWLEVP